MHKENMEKFKKELPPLPKKEDFKTFDEYDNAYLVFQKAHLEFLAKKYPDAFYEGSVWYGTHLMPEEVLKNGLPAVNSDKFDLEKHQYQFTTPEEAVKMERHSALRGSCEDVSVAAKFAGNGYYVYKILPYGGGIILEFAFGGRRADPSIGLMKGVLKPEEREIVIGARQLSSRIEGYRKVGDYSEAFDAYRLGEFIKNLNFKPRA